MAEGNEAVAILLLLALGVGGFLITFNIFPASLMNISFSDIHGATSGLFILMLRIIIAPAMMVLSVYVIKNIITG